MGFYGIPKGNTLECEVSGKVMQSQKIRNLYSFWDFLEAKKKNGKQKKTLFNVLSDAV